MGAFLLDSTGNNVETVLKKIWFTLDVQHMLENKASRE